MNISLHELQKIAGSTSPLAVWTAHAIIARFYCSRLAVANACTGNCQQNCKVHIKAICANLGQARNPAAVVTWRCKNEAAKKIETARAYEQHEPKRRPVIYSQPAPKENPFEALLDSL